MNQHPQFRTVVYHLGAFGSIEHHANAEFFTCLKATSEFKVSFDDAPATEFIKGLSYDAQVPFNKFRIENPNDAVMSVTLGIGRGGIKDARLVLSGAVETNELAASTFESPAPVLVAANSATLIGPANGLRKEILLKNMSATERLWIKSTGTTGEGGVPIDGREGIVLTTTAEIYAYNGNGVPVSVAVAEMEAVT